MIAKFKDSLLLTENKENKNNMKQSILTND